MYERLNPKLARKEKKKKRNRLTMGTTGEQD
jgi:hypothetical protein